MREWKQVRNEMLRDPEFAEYCKEMSVAEDIAKAITNRRLALNWTQQDLARRSGVSQADISRYENCEKLPTVGTLMKIAQAMCCSLKIDFIVLD